MNREPIAAQDWSAQERESFFDAIARHRRAAWQVWLVSHLCGLILAVVVALLLSPLFYAVLGILLDVVNLVLPMPDLIGTVMKALDPLVDTPGDVPLERWLYITLIAALPGLAVMGLVMLALHRIVREAEAGGAQTLAGRAPNPAALDEQRFSNVVGEMALAAGIPPPRLLVIESAAANAAAFGEHERSATIVVTTGLLERLERAQMQGAAGHLVGLIANGDVPQGLRVAQTLSLFGLVERLSDAIVDPQALKRFAPLLRSAFRRGASTADAELIVELTNPFGQTVVRTPTARAADKLTWQDWARMPLFGPVVFGGFFGGLVGSVVLEPLLALAWRRRKYMADAIAMQLTRDPDALAGALKKLAGVAADSVLPAWMAHMALAAGAMRGGMFGSGIALYPSLERRLRALGLMGSTVRVSGHRYPAWVWAVGIPVSAVIAVLLAVAIVLLVWVSVALSAIFTWLPTILIHAILR